MFANHTILDKKLRKYIKQTTDVSMNKWIDKYENKYKINSPFSTKYIVNDHESNPPLFLIIGAISLTSLVSFLMFKKK